MISTSRATDGPWFVATMVKYASPPATIGCPFAVGLADADLCTSRSARVTTVTGAVAVTASADVPDAVAVLSTLPAVTDDATSAVIVIAALLPA